MVDTEQFRIASSFLFIYLTNPHYIHNIILTTLICRKRTDFGSWEDEARTWDKTSRQVTLSFRYIPERHRGGARLLQERTGKTPAYHPAENLFCKLFCPGKDLDIQMLRKGNTFYKSNQRGICVRMCVCDKPFCFIAVINATLFIHNFKSLNLDFCFYNNLQCKRNPALLGKLSNNKGQHFDFYKFRLNSRVMWEAL